jgi:hypothetical protein
MNVLAPAPSRCDSVAIAAGAKTDPNRIRSSDPDEYANHRLETAASFIRPK